MDGHRLRYMGISDFRWMGIGIGWDGHFRFLFSFLVGLRTIYVWVFVLRSQEQHV